MTNSCFKVILYEDECLPQARLVRYTSADEPQKHLKARLKSPLNVNLRGFLEFCEFALRFVPATLFAT